MKYFFYFVLTILVIWSFFEVYKTQTSYNLPFPTPTISNDDKLFSLINSYRRQQGLPEFIKDNRLCEIAKDRADDKFSHQELYDKYSSYPYVIQENLSRPPLFSIAFNGWLKSPPHKKLLLSPYKYACTACKIQCVLITSSFKTDRNNPY